MIRLTKRLLSYALFVLLFSLPNNTAHAESNVHYTMIPMLQATQINEPSGITILPNGELLLTSTETNKIYVHTGDGNAEIFAGLNVSHSDGRPISGLYDDVKEDALFNAPSGLVVDDLGNVYVADTGNHAIRKIDTDGNVSTVSGNGVFGDQDGSGITAQFNSPADLAIAKDGTIYVADTLNHVIRSISETGEVTTVTKRPDRPVEINKNQVVNAGDFADGPINEAMFNEPTGLVLDEQGNLFVADSGNHVIRYIDFDSGEVSTIAGITVDNNTYSDTTLYGKGGYADGKTDSAKFNVPMGLALTSSGNLLVADSHNGHIRYINIDEQSVETISRQGDLLYPTNMTLLANGDIVVSDSRNNGLKKFILWEKPAGFGEYEDSIIRYDDEHRISLSARDAVYKVQRIGLMTGSGEEQYLFSPTEQLTRAQFAKIIVNHLGLKLIRDSDVFQDVADDQWYTPYIHTATTHGIINGYVDGSFQPNAPIKREQIALMIGRAYGWKKNDITQQLYSDQEKISEEALQYIHVLHDRGIMRGQLDGTFRPEVPVLRETAAVIMANFK